MAMAAITTRSYDNARSGTTYHENILTAANVRQRGIRRAYSIILPDDYRGTEGQVLIAPKIFTADGFTHDLLITSTMGNMLYAFDANANKPTLIWAQRLGNPVQGTRDIDEYVINPQWGILSTPVLDLAEEIIYSVSYSSPDGTHKNGVFYLHASSLVDGSAVHAPLLLESAIDQLGNKFSSGERKQRAALLMTDINNIKTLFIAAGSIYESLDSNLGWIIAVDLNTFKIKTSWSSCPSKGGGGIWMSGQGPAADKSGNIYVVTGNGSFDGVDDFGECVCKLNYDVVNSKLTLIDWFCPFMDDMRDGAIAPPGKPTNLNGWDDQDLGSSPIILCENLGFGINSGKDGIGYVTRLNNMGKTSLAELRNTTNYKALPWPPEWFTYYPGPNFDAAPADPTKLNFNFAGITHHLHASPVYYQPQADHNLIYCWGENGNLRAWDLMQSGELRYRGCSQEIASNQSPGMPGGMITVSANKTDPHSGVVWASVPYLDANKVISPGRLLAYDAININNGLMEKLWDSQDWGINYTHNKFNTMTVSGGRLFLPTYSGTIDVYVLA